MIMGLFGLILEIIALLVVSASFFYTEVKVVLLPVSLTISFIGWIIMIFFFEYTKPKVINTFQENSKN